MNLRVRRKDTGEEVEVLDYTADDDLFVAPPGRPGEGHLLRREALDPDPWDIIHREDIVSRWSH